MEPAETRAGSAGSVADRRSRPTPPGPSSLRCPGVLLEDPAFEELWPDCPMYFPVISWGGLCTSPRCMRPCRVVESTGPRDEPVRVRRFTYDDDGRVIRIDAEGIVSTWMEAIGYDAAGRPTERTHSLGGGVRYHREADGHLTRFVQSIPDSSDTTVDVTHGPHGPVRIEMTRSSEVVARTEYEYGPNGRLARHVDFLMSRMRDATLPGGGRTQTALYDYGPDGRLRSLRPEDLGGRRMELSYDRLGRVVSRRSNGHVATRFRYDHLGRLEVSDSRPVQREGYVAYEYECAAPER